MQQNLNSASNFTPDSLSEFVEKFINQTNQSVFLTGKAGTGKTTLLKRITSTTHKNTVVVAPTGIAALNAGGTTIHSFFQLPFGGFIPDFGPPPISTSFNTKDTLLRQSKFNKSKKDIYLKLELLIIDEVSMLRADLLDAIDYKLRQVRKKDIPFGGVQVLFIGDLFQLPPIVNPAEETILNSYYEGSFFFHAQAIKEQPPLYIELEKVFRQTDLTFINLLNNLRSNRLTTEDLDLLNNYVTSDSYITPDEGTITLTTHNKKADNINKYALSELPSDSFYYTATVNGTFPENIYPIEETIELKEGAQVMFIRNDASYEKRYYNGKIGKIHKLLSDEIHVIFPDGEIIEVEPSSWENTRFSLNNESGQIEEEIIGSFTQYPLRLAWAITIHKSQGLTFKKAILDLANVFAFGQAYVALSRLESLEGLTLTAPIQLNGLTSPIDIVTYAENKASADILPQTLTKSTQSFLKEKLEKAFNWEATVKKWQIFNQEHQFASTKSEIAQNKEQFQEQTETLTNTLEFSSKFRSQLENICNSEKPDLLLLVERVEAAYTYFLPPLEDVLEQNLKQITWYASNKTAKQYSERLTTLDIELTEVILTLKKARNLVTAISKDEKPDKATIWDSEIQNYRDLKRKKVYDELVAEHPLSFFTELAKTNITTEDSSNRKQKSLKEPTSETTYKLFKSGMSIDEIAIERELKEQTIFSHLCDLIEQDKIIIEDILSSDKLDHLIEVIGDDFNHSLSELMKNSSSKFTYNELRAYKASRMQSSGK